ncbi:unnamed protein product (macronuclear) [Paramecium tetraurelia]|uniref:Mitochondrial carrier protein n=1 Tax=Paramecium tetraurelia TaxID=5888 RepID=A0DL08_PARTE|nr:uncharacterized protein GSPATT00018042001 [Paramecium tetraurelia]CAK83725.1 unnamed protein product [Paramecium tetraurelia]|eukprot:XP_001451122.1 hypothetical protein (macronuclear) [Paramecium tetraurelia strain d4-2]
MDRLKDIESMAHGHAGALAGLFSTCLLYPLENIKTRMAASQQKEAIQEVIIQVWDQEGVWGFFKGVTPLALGNYISYGVYFFWYEYFKHLFKTDIANSFDLIKPSLASAILTTFVTNPFWVVQSRMTVSKDNLNFFYKTKQIIEKEGWEALMKGLQASLILTINPIIQFVIYEAFKRRLQYVENQALVNFIGGAISKAISTILTYPYQLLRTKIHVKKNSSKSYFSAVEKILKNEGIQGLFKGLTPKLCQSVLNSAFLLMFYEKIYEIIKQGIILIIIEILKYRKKLRKLQKLK